MERGRLTERNGETKGMAKRGQDKRRKEIYPRTKIKQPDKEKW